MRDDPLPVESVRDLLGITRALYRAELAGEGHPVRLQDLKTIGEQYRLALGLARRAPPGSLGHTAAWRWADEATDALCKLVGVETRAAPIVRAAALRIRGRQGGGQSDHISARDGRDRFGDASRSWSSSPGRPWRHRQ